MKVWGCIAHAHVPKVNRGKLDNRSVKCVLLGMSEGTKGYRLYNTETKKIIIAKDVVFEEQLAFDWGKGHEKQIEAELEWEDDMLAEEVTQLHQNGNIDHEDNQEENQEDHDDTDDQDDPSTETSINSDGNDQGRAINTEIETSQDGQSSRRTHKKPAWMTDYVSENELSDDEVNLVQVEEDIF
ncbi:hypothetical protein LIER_09417 [Lithospermum erythrorhizon]|uniref:Retroviral polymerase SH3-like domain-containing protein n=1 Tax=Lithospermum erythrorhizon TaxID=34254 RepID=A0AAV3PII5_LITER